MIGPGLAAVAGTATAALYFNEGERGIPAESSCTYLAPWTTDAAAWLIGAVLLARGIQQNDPVIAFAGAAVATLHVAQFAAHKVITRPSPEAIPPPGTSRMVTI